MSQNERVWENNPETSPSRLRPVEHDAASVEALPLGGEVILADFIKESLSTGDWDDENRDHLLPMVRALGGIPGNIAMLYLPPLPDDQSVVDLVVHENYGPEGDPEVWAVAQNFALAGMPTTSKMLLDIALDMGHLDGDGIAAMMREAARKGGGQ